MKCMLRSIILSLFLLLITLTAAYSAEIDDSTVFVDAFNAFQQKDYLLAIEKCEQLNQAFPDSPLRDVTLLLIARASLKAGDNARAAKSAFLFSTEFPDSSLKTSVEEELKVLAGRHRKGEVLAADKALQSAARKVSSERIARERAAELKLEMERTAKAKAEQDRIARLKQEEERRERERIIAEKLAKANIKVAIAIREGAGAVPVGTTGSLPIEITNNGKSSEEFMFTVTAPKEYEAILAKTEKSDEAVSRLQLAVGESFRGFVVFKMPSDMVDGHRSAVTIRAASAKFSDINFHKDAVLISSAPLVRAVAKLAKPKVTSGERLRYRVTVLNVGSLPANNLTVRLQLPPQIEFISAPDFSFRQESNGIIAIKIDQVDIGKLSEIGLDVKIRDDVTIGQELRGHVEVINESLQRKESFNASASVVVRAR